MVRTTLEIDDRVLRAARTLAAQHGYSLGRAVSELAIRGMSGSRGEVRSSGFPLLPRSAVGHVITDELVAEHLDDA